ncbi:MAG: HypC/HybG/HupF family hydrogenase formation chaperone [Pseudomonadota bacterium]
MCVGVPMRILETDGLQARCAGLGETPGEAQTVSLALVGPVEAGAYVLTHLGSAVRALDEREAVEIADALEAVRRAAAGAPFDHLLQDLIDREPELPAHLRDAAKDGAARREEDDL